MSPLQRPFAGVATVALLAGIAAACGSGKRASSDSADGASVYAANCASCHGADLRGTELGPSQLSIVYEPSHHGDDSYRSAIRNGAPQHHWSFGDMAPIEGLDDDDIDAVVTFIRDTQEREGFEPYSP